MKHIGIFCGSGAGNKPLYEQQARAVAKKLALQDYTIVYGAGNIGLMGAVADEALQNNGKVIGVIPEFMMPKGICHSKLTQLIITKDMHERKMQLGQLSDVFIALPGGYGTLDEVSEMLTFTQLGIFQKPVGLLNINGYFDHLIQFADRMHADGFMSAWHRSALIDDSNLDSLLDKLASFEKKDISKWFEEHDYLEKTAKG